MKILLLKYRNIGDVLLITPLIENLRVFYPNANIDVSVNKGTESMLTLNPNLNKVITYDRNFIKSLPFLKKIWKEFKFYFSFRKEKYDIVINLTKSDRGNLIALFSKASRRIGYINSNWISRIAITHHLPVQSFRHTIETNLDPLRILNIPIRNKRVKIFWDEKDSVVAENILPLPKRYIHIHPLSRWQFKCIADSTMAYIIDYCEEVIGIKTVITASNEKIEIDKIHKILSLCRTNPINLSGKLTLKQTALINSKAVFFIGVDTAIMHISASNDTPVLAFFGPSGADHWGPWDNDLIDSGYSQRSGFQSMGRHRVFSESRLCQPCGQDGCPGTKISDCLMSMDLDEIKKNIREMVNGKSDKSPSY
jgi:heptosyltransferase-3